MRRTAVSFFLLSAGLLAANSSVQRRLPLPQPLPPRAQNHSAPAAARQPAWVLRSNQYTQMLLDVQMKLSPERASLRGSRSTTPR